MDNLKLTDVGKMLLNKALSHTDTITFTKLELSSHEYESYEIPQLEELQDVKQTIEVSSVEIKENGVVEIIAGQDNLEIEESYYLNTVGLWASDENENDILYGVSINIESADLIQDKSHPSSITFKFSVIIEDTENVDVSVTPTLSVTVLEFNQYKEQVNDKFGEITDDLSEFKEDVTEKLEKGVINGVYTGICESSRTAVTKYVDVDESFELIAGSKVLVNFVNGNSSSVARLSVNKKAPRPVVERYSKQIVRYDNYELTGWNLLVFDGEVWVNLTYAMVEGWVKEKHDPNAYYREGDMFVDSTGITQQLIGNLGPSSEYAAISKSESLNSVIRSMNSINHAVRSSMGRNLIPYPYKDLQINSPINLNGITFEVASNGSISLAGQLETEQGIWIQLCGKIKLDPSKTYTLSVSPPFPEHSQPQFYIYLTHDDGSEYVYEYNSVKITGKSYITDILIVISHARPVDTIVYPMLEEGTVSHAFEPPVESTITLNNKIDSKIVDATFGSPTGTLKLVKEGTRTVVNTYTQNTPILPNTSVVFNGKLMFMVQGSPNIISWDGLHFKQEISTDIPTHFSIFFMFVSNEKLHIIAADTSVIGRGYVYVLVQTSAHEGTWDPLIGSQLPYTFYTPQNPMNYHGLLIHDQETDYLHLIGGYFKQNGYYYQPTRESAWIQGPDLPYNFEYGAFGTIMDHKVHVFSGLGSKDTARFHYRFDDVSWTKLSNLPAELVGASIQVRANDPRERRSFAHVFGGTNYDGQSSAYSRYTYSTTGDMWSKVDNLPIDFRYGSVSFYHDWFHLLPQDYKIYTLDKPYYTLETI